MVSRPPGHLVDGGELAGQLGWPQLAHPDSQEQVDALGPCRDASGKPGGIDAECIARGQQHVVEAVAFGCLDNVRAVLPRARQRGVRHAQKLVVVVAERREPRNLGQRPVAGHVPTAPFSTSSSMIGRLSSMERWAA